MRVELIDCYLPDDSRWWGSWRNVREPEVAPVFEDRWYSLALYEYDRTGEYRVFVGDEELKLESREFTNSLEFARGVYFESASGATELSVVQTKDGRIRQPILTHHSLEGFYLCIIDAVLGFSLYRQKGNTDYNDPSFH